MTTESDPSTDETLGVQETPGVVPAVDSVIGDRYRIVREIGRGGMGAVFLARDTRLNEDVALKVLVGSNLSQYAAERFRREVKLSRRVTHHNVARMFDIGEFGQAQFLTMEFIEGESLASVLAREHALPLPRVLDIAIQVCKGLAAAHDAGVIHRDLKPANVLIDASGRAAITDFGIARSVASDASMSGGAEQLLGTPAFMAPEQVRGHEVTAAADIYALGLVLYRMVTGHNAFEADTPLAVAVARLERAAEDPRLRVADLPVAVADVILHCLSREPDDRPADARLVAQALSRAIADTTRGDDAALDYSPSGQVLRPFAPIEPGGVGIAILPFRFQGPAEQAYVADALTEDLIDILSMTRGLQVCSSGATNAYAERRDPKLVATALSVDKIIDGNVRPRGSQLRISVRVIDGATGFQAYRGQFDVDFDDVLQMQDEIAQQVAEALRVELEHRTQTGNVSPEVLELYLKACSAGPQPSFHAAVRAIDLLERVVQEAPEFKLGPPRLASAYLMVWFMPGVGKDVDYGTLARSMVQRALRIAPDVAETHYVAARLAVAEGKYGEAAASLAEALRIAPTYASAHDYLGMLQLECGRPTEGRKRVEFAMKLDPDLEFGMLALVKHFAVKGDDEAFEQLTKIPSSPQRVFTLVLTRIRRAAWRREFDVVNALCEQLRAVPGGPSDVFAFLQYAISGGELPDDLAKQLSLLMGANVSPRGWSFALQVTAEVLGIRGDGKRALDCVREAVVEGVLADIEWIRKCPALDLLREDPEFQELQEQVERRAAAVWMTM